jgi:hypothetical protein
MRTSNHISLSVILTTISLSVTLDYLAPMVFIDEFLSLDCFIRTRCKQDKASTVHKAKRIKCLICRCLITTENLALAHDVSGAYRNLLALTF